MAKNYANDRYLLAEKTYGPLVDKLRQDVPKNLALAHVSVMNPANLNRPKVSSKNQGFMLASISAAKRVNILWNRMDNPLVCAYVWFNDANRLSYLLYSNYKTFFPLTNEDFWKCAYLEIVLEDPAFFSLWNLANPVAGQSGGIYGQLKAQVETLRASLPGWPIASLRKQVLLDMETLFSIARLHGPLTSTGPGRPPYLNKDDASRIFVE
jgi:hypothetical protein